RVLMDRVPSLDGPRRPRRPAARPSRENTKQSGKFRAGRAFGVPGVGPGFPPCPADRMPFRDVSQKLVAHNASTRRRETTRLLTPRGRCLRPGRALRSRRGVDLAWGPADPTPQSYRTTREVMAGVQERDAVARHRQARGLVNGLVDRAESLGQLALKAL